MVAGTSPAATISRMSSISRVSGASRILTGAFLALASRSFSAFRLSMKLDEARTYTSRPDRSSAVATGGASGAVTTISEMFRRLGMEKSTCFRRSGVMVIFPTAMSPRPWVKPGMSSSRDTGTNITCTRIFRLFSFLLSSSSNIRPRS